MSGKADHEFIMAHIRPGAFDPWQAEATMSKKIRVSECDSSQHPMHDSLQHSEDFPDDWRARTHSPTVECTKSDLVLLDRVFLCI